MLYVLCCLWAMYALLFCCSLKEWNSGPLEAQLSFANDSSRARILLSVMMISGFCQKRYVKCHSIYLCLWFCLLLNTSAVSAVWWYFVVCWCWGSVIVWFSFYGWRKFGFSFNYFYNNIWGTSLLLEREDKVIFLECMFSTACWTFDTLALQLHEDSCGVQHKLTGVRRGEQK